MPSPPAATKNRNHNPKRGADRRRDYNLFQSLDLSQASVEQVPGLIRQALRDHLARVVDAFRQFDDDGTGRIDSREFAKNLTQMGLDAPQPAIDAIFHSFDRDGSGTITYAELDAIIRRSVRKNPRLAMPGGAPPASKGGGVGAIGPSPDGKAAKEEGGAPRKKVKVKVPKPKPKARPAEELEERPKWDARTRVVYKDELQGGRASLGEPSMPFPLPWGVEGGPGRSET